MVDLNFGNFAVLCFCFEISMQFVPLLGFEFSRSAFMSGKELIFFVGSFFGSELNLSLHSIDYEDLKNPLVFVRTK